ncbi:MAG: hypothetical protein AVDCRST_MAG64-3786, partial [uncultured Phycisphaerae bacterium]
WRADVWHPWFMRSPCPCSAGWPWRPAAGRTSPPPRRWRSCPPPPTWHRPRSLSGQRQSGRPSPLRPRSRSTPGSRPTRSASCRWPGRRCRPRAGNWSTRCSPP